MTDRIVIFGPYKSGTTGLFYKIRNSMAYRPRILFESLRYDPLTDDTTTGVLAKIILGLVDGKPAFEYNGFRVFEKKILLLRDPRDWLVSGILFLPQQHPEIYRNPPARNAIISLLQQKEREPDRIPFSAIFHAVIHAIKNDTSPDSCEWIAAHLNALIQFDQSLSGHIRIRYEDFVAQRLAELQGYLGFPLAGDATVDAVHNHVPRSLKSGDWKNWFIAEDAGFFAPVCEAFIRHYGYDPDWSFDGARRIPTSIASGYVERTIAKRLNDSTGH